MSPRECVPAGRRLGEAGVLLVALLVAAACSSDGAEPVVLVFAAASLAEAFTDVETQFEAANPGVDVRLNLAGSPTLREQVLAGAPADVFVSADPSHVELLAGAGVVDPPAILALNRMIVGVPTGNPGAVTGLSDFADDQLEIGLCAESVPCGRLARTVLAMAGVVPAPDTEESDVRSLVTRLEADELDAAIVYVSDVVSGEGEIEGIPIAERFNVVTDYPIARILTAPNPSGAQDFIDFALSPAGQATLARYGFETP